MAKDRKAKFRAQRVICPYCGRRARYVTGDTVYRHRPDLNKKRFYQCEPCDALVGVHKGTNKPLGVLAKPDLRLAKRNAHAAFDPLWKSGAMTRSEAYGWLAKVMRIAPVNCHIGMFDVQQCERVVKVCKERFQ